MFGFMNLQLAVGLNWWCRMFNVISGDLLKMIDDSRFELVAHGCNCFHTMGAGFAKKLNNKYPQALIADKKTAYGAIEKLGSYSSTDWIYGDSVLVEAKPFKILNCYTQFNYGRGIELVDYGAMDNVFERIKKDFSNDGGYLTIGMPLICWRSSIWFADEPKNHSSRYTNL